MNDDDKKLAAYIAGCCLIGIVAVILASLIFIPSRARADGVQFDAQWVEIEGERHLVIAPSGQLKLALRFKAQDEEIARLQAMVDAKYKAECNLI